MHESIFLFETKKKQIFRIYFLKINSAAMYVFCFVLDYKIRQTLYTLYNSWLDKENANAIAIHMNMKNITWFALHWHEQLFHISKSCFCKIASIGEPLDFISKNRCI